MPSEMEMQRQLEERMSALLEHANYQSVGDAVGVTRTQVWRWAHGKSVTPGAVTRVQAVMRPDLPEITNEAAPSVTRRLLAGVIALQEKAGVTPAELTDAEKKAATLLEADARLAAALEASQRRSSSRVSDRVGGLGADSPGSKRRTP